MNKSHTELNAAVSFVLGPVPTSCKLGGARCGVPFQPKETHCFVGAPLGAETMFLPSLCRVLECGAYARLERIDYDKEVF